MDRAIENILLHVIFEPKDYIGSGVPRDFFYHKFIMFREQLNDGVSFDEVFLGHGRLIKKRGRTIFDARRATKPSKYKKYSYIYTDPQQFLSQPFATPEIMNKCGGTLFRITPDRLGPTHVLISLSQRIEVKKDGYVTTGFIVNGEDICSEEDITGILFELYKYFSVRKLSLSDCAKNGYFSDCQKIDHGIECANNC